MRTGWRSGAGERLRRWSRGRVARSCRSVRDRWSAKSDFVSDSKTDQRPIGRIRRFRTSLGQSLVETALAMPLLLLIGFGVVGAGRVIQVRMGVHAVAREAARAAALADGPNHAVDAAAPRAHAVAD